MCFVDTIDKDKIKKKKNVELHMAWRVLLVCNNWVCIEQQNERARHLQIFFADN